MRASNLPSADVKDVVRVVSANACTHKLSNSSAHSHSYSDSDVQSNGKAYETADGGPNSCADVVPLRRRGRELV
jgi:hypothetical protein